jgi:P27 family predicted phage terminase small subunit
MKGRKPKPTDLKLVEGNRGKRRLPKREAKPQRVIPSPPAHLSERGREIWGWATSVLDRMAVLTEADPLALERLCETLVEIEELKDDIREHGRYQQVETKVGGVMERARPAVGMLQDADRRVRAWLTEFGLTPSARARVPTRSHDEGKDPAEAYFA